MIYLRQFTAAIRFLTIIPLPGKIGTDSEDLQGTLPYFSIVGLLLGILSGLAAWFLWSYFPSYVASVLLTIVLLSFSGALHLDGLADSADGFFSSRKREQILEIMRDSRVGVMGVVALVMILLLKVSVLSQMNTLEAVQTAILMPIGGRAALVLMMYLLPYVRGEDGMGTIFYGQRDSWALAITLAVFVSCCVGILGPVGMATAMAVLIVIFLFSRFCQRKIGGATGDTLGAGCEIVETVIPFAMFFSFYLS